jgi:phenylpropionate dioxygenase-like ring-hydroxylating dioxygenase large terminal subunit
VPALFIDLGRAVEGKVFDRPYPAGTGRFESVRVHPQMVLENAVDPTHFRFVHGTPDVPVLLSQEVTANEWRSLVGFGKRWAACPPVDSERRGTLTILFSGVGIGFNALVDQESTVVVLIATTPVDAERSDLFQTVWVQEVSGEAPQSHDDRRINALAALPQDLTIWEHQRYLNPAGLSREEVRGFNEIRRWGARFYPDPAVSTTRSGRLADRPSPPRA